MAIDGIRWGPIGRRGVVQQAQRLGQAVDVV